MNNAFINLKLLVAKCLVFVFFLASTLPALARNRKVLYIGNSYIFTNNMPSIVDSIARTMGDTIIYDVSAPGGYTFNQHTRDATTISKIFSNQWDIVILQEQSQMPSFPPGQVATDVYPFAARLDSMVKANDTCTQVMFLMTWGRANGDASNCASYPPICTYTGMQMRLRESYMQMAQDNDALVAPVGMAFKVFKDSVYPPLLYSPDSSHPSMAGSYLEACVIYSSIFHRKTINCSFLSGLLPGDAARLQRIADKVVFDSLKQWQENGAYPFANFGKTVSGSRVTFTNQVTSPTKHTWSFGDATTDTAANPVHSYGTTGRYVISHTSYNDCFSETATDSVAVVTSGINDSKDPGLISVAYNNDAPVFQINTQEAYTLELYNANGASVALVNNLQDLRVSSLAPGIYFYRFMVPASSYIITGKVLVR